MSRPFNKDIIKNIRVCSLSYLNHKINFSAMVDALSLYAVSFSPHTPIHNDYSFINVFTFEKLHRSNTACITFSNDVINNNWYKLIYMY